MKKIDIINNIIEREKKTFYTIVNIL